MPVVRPLLLGLALAAVASTALAQPGMTCTPTRADAQRIARLDQAWSAALADARAGGAARDLRRLGAVVEPRLKLDRPQPTPGRYQCRTIKLGAGNPAGVPFIAYGWFRCQVDLTPGGDLILRKITGSQRPVGLICPIEGPDERRATQFVGVLELGDERRTPRYGAEPERDLIGRVQRTGNDRWRLALPWPAAESKLDVLELRRVR